MPSHPMIRKMIINVCNNVFTERSFKSKWTHFVVSNIVYQQKILICELGLLQGANNLRKKFVKYFVQFFVLVQVVVQFVNDQCENVLYSSNGQSFH